MSCPVSTPSPSGSDWLMLFEDYLDVIWRLLWAAGS